MTNWLDEIESQADETSPYYLPRLIAEIRRLRERETAASALYVALFDLLNVIANDELIPETVSYMRQARRAIEKAERESAKS